VWWSGPNGQNQVIVYNGNSSNSGYGFIVYSGGGDKVAILLGGVAFLTSDANLTQARWQHVAAVRSVGVWSLYIDGVSRPLTDTAATPRAPAAATSIGSQHAGGELFNGVIDDVRIWNYARSAAQMDSTRNFELRGDEDGLAAYWRLNEGYEPSTGAPRMAAVDASGRGQTATIQGRPSWWWTGDRLVSRSPQEWIRDIQVLINVYSCPAGYLRNPRDLNQGAGGRDIFACVAYGAQAGALDYLGFVFGSRGDVRCTVNNSRTLTVDLNSGAGGDFIYFCLRNGTGAFNRLDFDVSTFPYARPCGWSPQWERPLAVSSPGWTWLGGDLNKGVVFSTYIYPCAWYAGFPRCVTDGARTGCGD
jgi:hypothetical protein